MQVTLDRGLFVLGLWLLFFGVVLLGTRWFLF